MTQHGFDDGLDPTLVDPAALVRWMDDEGLPGGPIERVERLAGGTQNILLRFSRGGREYVLRRPPRHLRAASNEVLRREARVLAALADTDVPHPGLIAAATDESRFGVVLYLMEPVRGVNITTGLAEAHHDPEVRHRMGLEAARAVARLGAVDHVSLGLSDFGRPEGFLERQVSRWMAELESYNRLEGYPGPDLPGLDRIADWLERNRPSTSRPGLMHGDYHLANVFFSPDGPEVAAILDWEMCTVGDPLVDLGWLLAMWPGPGAIEVGPAMGLNGLDGWATAEQLVAAYGELSTRDLTSIDWYTVFACFKCGIILEGTHARAAAGKADRGVGDILHAVTVALFEKALTII